MVEEERRFYGVDHASIGAELCARWGVGRAVTEIVACHHSGPRSEALAGAVAALQLADSFVHAVDEHVAVADIDVDRFRPMLGTLGLEPRVWIDVRSELADAFASAQHALPS